MNERKKPNYNNNAPYPKQLLQQSPAHPLLPPTLLHRTWLVRNVTSDPGLYMSITIVVLLWAK